MPQALMNAVLEGNLLPQKPAGAWHEEKPACLRRFLNDLSASDVVFQQPACVSDPASGTEFTGGPGDLVISG